MLEAGAVRPLFALVVVKPPPPQTRPRNSHFLEKIEPHNPHTYGKANGFPQIFFRICFRNERGGQAQATTAGHTYGKKHKVPEVCFHFAFVIKQRENPKSRAFFLVIVFCENGKYLLTEKSALYKPIPV